MAEDKATMDTVANDIRLSYDTAEVDVIDDDFIDVRIDFDPEGDSVQGLIDTMQDTMEFHGGDGWMAFYTLQIYVRKVNIDG